jgi:hypothetical protein
MQDANDLNRTGVGTINDEVVGKLLNGPELDETACEFLAHLTALWRLGEKTASVVNCGFNPVGGIRILASDIAPYLEQIGFRFRRKPSPSLPIILVAPDLFALVQPRTDLRGIQQVSAFRGGVSGLDLGSDFIAIFGKPLFLVMKHLNGSFDEFVG